MILRRVEVDPSSTFFLLHGSIDAFFRLSHVDSDTPRPRAITMMLEDLRLAAQQGWFYVNPRDENQLIAYCDNYTKPFWYVVANGDRDGFKQTDRDYAVITVLSHRDSKFQDAIREHREIVESSS